MAGSGSNRNGERRFVVAFAVDFAVAFTFFFAPVVLDFDFSDFAFSITVWLLHLCVALSARAQRDGRLTHRRGWRFRA